MNELFAIGFIFDDEILLMQYGYLLDGAIYLYFLFDHGLFLFRALQLYLDTQ